MLLLVANDVDAICAARALAKMLSEDEIMFRIAPIDGFRTLQRVIQEDVLGNEDVRTNRLGSSIHLDADFTVIHCIPSYIPSSY